MSGIENRWALFTRSGPRCGPLTALSQFPVHEKDVVAVPAPSGPHMAVLMRIDLHPTLIDQLFRGVVAPLTIPTVVLDGVTYRLVAANAVEPFLLNTPASVDDEPADPRSHRWCRPCPIYGSGQRRCTTPFLRDARRTLTMGAEAGREFGAFVGGPDRRIYRCTSEHLLSSGTF